MSTNPRSPVPASNLGLTVAEFRRLGYQAVDLAADYLESVAERPVFKPMTPREREALLTQALPEQAVAPDTILRFVHDQILTHPMGNGHPRFFGWVNSPPAMLAVITELLAAALNPSCAGGDHAVIYLERCILRWLMELVGFPVEGSMGLLVSGGSMASLTCLAAARYWAAHCDGWNVRADGLQGQRLKLTMYVSEEGHSCLRKAADLLGLGEAGIRTVPVDDAFRIDVAALERTVKADRASGLRPFCVVGSAGTVNTGAIDPLSQLADFCAEQNLWLHVDGAYGAVGILDEEVAPRYRGLERAHSLALDPHKWLCVPVECGCAIVRDGALLRETFSLVPSYLRTEEGKGFGGLLWFSEYGFQQSRGLRALKVWATLEQAGRAGLRRLIRRHNRLARRLASLVEAEPGLELLAPVELSVVCFRYTPARLRNNEERLNDFNKRLMETIQAEGEAFVSGTVLKGQFALRACVLHYGTSEEDIAALIRTVCAAAIRLG